MAECIGRRRLAIRLRWLRSVLSFALVVGAMVTPLAISAAPANATSDPSLVPVATTPAYGQIASSANSGLCIAPSTNADGAIPDGAALQLTSCLPAGTPNSTEQFWSMLPNLTITTDHGMCLDDFASGVAEGNQVGAWTCNDGANQQWQAEPNGTLINLASGKCLDSTPPSVQSGSPLPPGTPGMSLHTCSTNPATQTWIVPHQHGPLALTNSNRLEQAECLNQDTSDATATAHGVTDERPCIPGTAGQDWTFAGDGTLRVTNYTNFAGPGCLTKLSKATSYGFIVNTQDCTPSLASQQHFIPTTSGMVLNPDTGDCLNLGGNSTYPVVLSPCTGSANQIFTLPIFHGHIAQQGLSSLCVDAASASTTGQAQDLPCSTDMTQQITYTDAGNLVYNIPMAVGVTNAGPVCMRPLTTLATDVHAVDFDPCSVGNQVWVPFGDGTIRDTATWECLTFGWPGQPSQIVLAPCTAAANQLLTLAAPALDPTPEPPADAVPAVPAVTQFAVASDSANGPVEAEVKADGTAWVQEGTVYGSWWVQLPYTGVSQVAVASDPTNGPLLAVLVNGTMYAYQNKQLGLRGLVDTGNWVNEYSGVTQIAVGSDSSNGPLIGVLANGTALAKEGGLSNEWVNEHAGVTQLVLASDSSNGPLIGVLANGTALVKEGGLSNGWTSYASTITQMAVASDSSNGPLIGLLTGGTAFVSEGSLSAGWVNEYSGVTQISLASDSSNGPLIGIVANGTPMVKEGALNGDWVGDYPGATQISVASASINSSDGSNGPVIGIVDNNGNAVVKAGGLNTSWINATSQPPGSSGPLTGMTVGGPPSSSPWPQLPSTPANAIVCMLTLSGPSLATTTMLAGYGRVDCTVPVGAIAVTLQMYRNGALVASTHREVAESNSFLSSVVMPYGPSSGDPPHGGTSFYVTMQTVITSPPGGIPPVTSGSLRSNSIQINW